MIPIRNIYHMLAYAYQALSAEQYRRCGVEEFENAAELTTKMLTIGVSSLVKRGLGRAYRERMETTSFPHGKIDFSASVRSSAFFSRQLVCSYDEFSIDTPTNRILRSTMERLARSNLIPVAQKQELRALLPFFREAGLVELKPRDWRLAGERNDPTERALTELCRLIVDGLILTESKGPNALRDFIDEQKTCRLYEKFILEYYRKHFPKLSPSSTYIDWAIGPEDDPSLLPKMRTDVTLQFDKRVLILDAKFYQKTTVVNFGARRLHAENLYQLFAYVKNKEAELAAAGRDYEVAGALLYAKTEDDEELAARYKMCGNRIEARTIALDRDFDAICAQLDAVVAEFF